jgi:hypothetical protein
MVNDTIHIDDLLLIVIHGIFAGLVHEYSGPPVTAGASVLTVQNFLALTVT